MLLDKTITMAKRIPIPRKTLDKWLTKASLQLQREDYGRVILTCQRVLRSVAENDPRRAEALRYLGTAHAMKGENQHAFDAFSEAITLEPNEFDVWYNRGLASLFTSRLGGALKDFRKAATLCTDRSFKQRIVERLEFTEPAVREACALRGPDFTLEQLIEQEELVQRGVALMEKEAWSDAEQRFRDVIAMGDVLPQPWGNLGICLLMQHRYDEAEEALQRALEIDADYELARANLAMLEEIRADGIAPRVIMSDPFAKAKRSIDFFSE